MARTNSSRSTSSRRGSAIIYDSESQTITTRKLSQSEGMRNSFCIEKYPLLNGAPESRIIVERNAPKWNSHARIYVGENEEKRLALTLNLDTLGWTTNIKRLCGKFKNIYVVEGADGAHHAPPPSLLAFSWPAYSAKDSWPFSLDMVFPSGCGSSTLSRAAQWQAGTIGCGQYLSLGAVNHPPSYWRELFPVVIFRLQWSSMAPNGF